MSYSIIQPPFTLVFREMSKQELRDYFQWFMDVLPQRINELAGAVRRTHDFATWQPDHTPASLDVLGNWFAAQVETRLRTPKELQEIEKKLVFPMEIPREELTDRTFSLAMDVGMYFSQVLIKSHPSLRWELPTRNKRFADYGQPVLVGFGRVPLNPIGIAVTSAYGIAAKNPRPLRDVYDVWSRMVSP